MQHRSGAVRRSDVAISSDKFDRFRHSLYSNPERKSRQSGGIRPTGTYHAANLIERNRQATNKMKQRRDKMDKRLEAERMYSQIQQSKELASFEKIRQLSMYYLSDNRKSHNAQIMMRRS